MVKSSDAYEAAKLLRAWVAQERGDKLAPQFYEELDTKLCWIQCVARLRDEMETAK